MESERAESPGIRSAAPPADASGFAVCAVSALVAAAVAMLLVPGLGSRTEPAEHAPATVIA